MNMSDVLSTTDEQSDKECPLCMEPLEIDDINFYPCKCDYQICRFCWHRLRTDENGLCPACRQPYPEDPVNFKPLSASDVQKIKSEKKQKQQQQRLKICESRKHLSSYRVLQKNLVYVVGLSARVADPETLKKSEYFGKYGRIMKVAVGSSLSSNGPQSASCTAYVTYSRYEDALRAIQAVNNAQLDGRIVKASLGTTKYCTNFLRSQPCHKPECMYLHNVADVEVSFTKDDMHLGRHAEYEKKLIESTFGEKEQGRSSLITIARRMQSKSGSSGRKLHDGSSIENWKEDIQSEKNVDKKSYVDNLVGTSIAREMVKSGSNSSDNESEIFHVQTEAKRDDAVDSTTAEQFTSSKMSSNPTIQEICNLCTDKNQDVELNSRSHLSQWISGHHSSANGATCESIEKIFHSGQYGCQATNLKHSPSQTVMSTKNQCDWQRTLGISVNSKDDANTCVSSDFQVRPAPRHSKLSIHSDDDLGFDPFSESAKGLADLLEEEKMKSSASGAQSAIGLNSTTSLMSLGLQCGWPSINTLNGFSDSNFRNSRITDTEHRKSTPSFTNSENIPQQPLKMLYTDQEFVQPFPPALRPSQASSRMFLSPVNQRSSILPAMSSKSECAIPLHCGVPQRCAQYNAPHRSSSEQNASTVNGSKILEWQEGFRALLPNVNVRFLPDVNSTGFESGCTSLANLQHINSVQETHNFEQNALMSTQYSLTPIASPTAFPLNSYSYPSHWTMPPPGFTYVSKR